MLYVANMCDFEDQPAADDSVRQPPDVDAEDCTDVGAPSCDILIRLPNAQDEWIPCALLRATIISLPDDLQSVRDQVSRWLHQPQLRITIDDLSKVESALLRSAHDRSTEAGLLNRVGLDASGHLVDPANLPLEWDEIRAPVVLALAIRRFRTLSNCLGSTIETIDQDEPRST